MKRSLLILCALLLTGIGAWAQGTASYEFKAENWVVLDDHSAGTSATVDTSNNTISVTYTGNEAGIGNMGTMSTSGANTANYTVTANQYWFVIVGTDLSTTGHLLWWMNGYNDGMTVSPTEVVTLTDGSVVLAWDLSKSVAGTNLQNETNTLSGGTCFGLIADDPSTGFTITDINFYTEADFETLISAKPYTFNCRDWVASDNGRASADKFTYDDTNNTITVTASGANNISMGNSTEMSQWGGITTADMTVSKDQKWFVVIGTDLSTTNKTDSYLWWLNGTNKASQVEASKVETLDDGSVLVAWDVTTSELNDNLQNDVNLFEGWTCFGLTSTDTGGKSTIYYIGFYTDDELTAKLGASHFCEAISSHWSIEPDPETTESGALFYVDQADKEDASGMTPPYMTYYMWEGEAGNAANHLPAAVISHDQLTLTPGLYEISMDIRIIDYDTDATVGEGTLFSANGVSQDIKLGVDANDGSYTENGDHEDLYGTYTLYVQVEADSESDTGSLSISLTIPEDATYNWISWKNLTVTPIESEPTVEWTLGAQYGTLMLPFDYTLTEDSGLTAYTISEVSDNEVTLSEGTTSIEAGVPYIIGGTASEEAITFTGMPTAYNVSYTSEAVSGASLTGVLVDTYAPANSYVLQKQEETPAFYLVESDETITVGAYHCYLNYTATAGAKLVVNFPDTDDVATRIDAVETEETANDAIYDLSGRRVAKAQKGIYIVNGKKMVIK